MKRRVTKQYDSEVEEDKDKEFDGTHECQLPQEQELLQHYISDGHFIDIRRRFRNWLMLNENSPKSKNDLKSSAVVRSEKQKHLRDHYYMIHPFSKFRFYWESSMIVVLFVILVVIPIQLCMPYISENSLYFRMSLDVICVIDIVISFNTGYQHTRTKKIVMSRKNVATHYLSTWFAIDLISCINADTILLFTIIFLPNSELAMYWPMKLPNCVKLLRIITLMNYLERFRSFLQLNFFRFKLIKLLLCTALLLWWTSCAYYILSREFRDDWIRGSDEHAQFTRRFVLCLWEVTELFLLMEHHPTKSVCVVGFQMVCLVIGVVVQLFVLSQVLETVQKSDASSKKFTTMSQQLIDYMDSKDLPASFMARVMSYFTFKFQKNYYKETEIMGTLSNSLRSEINMYICQRLFTNVLLLKNMPNSVMVQLINSVKKVIYLANDIIVKAGDIGDEMFFISSGMVAVYSPSGMEVCHLSDGANFGEVSMVMPHSTRVATVVALDYCDLYVLHRKDFLKAISEYPYLHERVMYIARQRMKAMILSEQKRHRPQENYDFRTPEGIEDFKAKMYEF